jgi:hypothetical protein
VVSSWCYRWIWCGLSHQGNNNIDCNLTRIGADSDKSTFGIFIPKQWIYAQNPDANILVLRKTDALDDLRLVYDKRLSSKSNS